MCEASKIWLRQRALQLVASKYDEPLLVQSSADCTPVKTMSIYTKSCDEMSVRRHGRRTAEYLVQRVFVMGLDRRPFPVFREPMEMANKTASAHMQAHMELFPNAREVGHRGLLVEHRVYDRAIMSALKKLWDRWAAAHRHFQEINEGEAQAHKLWLFHWRSIVGCFSHDCHGGLRWGCFRHLADKQTVKDAYISVESLRNGFDVLAKNMKPWIKAHLTVQDSSMSREERCELWSMLGLGGEWLDAILDLELRFEDDRLKIGRGAVRDGVASRIESVILRIYKFEKFSDSRWVTLGGTGRSVIGGMIVGLRSLVEFCIADPSSSSYYIAGFRRATTPILKLFAVVAMSSFVADGALKLVLKDGRLPRILGEVDHELVSEFRYVSGMSCPVWSVVAVVVGISEAELIDDCIMSALAQVAYIYFKTKPARGFPYKLNRGDKVANLEALKASSTRPEEETTGKIWELLQRGVPVEDLLPGLNLLDEADWTATPVEQGHVKASRLMQKHPGYTSDAMQSRAQVSTLTALFSKSQADIKVERLQARIDKAAKYSAGHFGGRQLFLRALNETADDAASRGRDWKCDNLRRFVMKAHGRLWGELATEERDRYEKLACYERDKKKDAKHMELECLWKKLDEAKAEQHDFLSVDEPLLRLGACSLSKDELADFDSFCCGSGWTQAKVAELRADAAKPVGCVDEQTQAALDSMQIATESPPWHPAWMSVVARHRAELRGSIFKVCKCNETHYLAFVFAMQNPVFGCFVVVQREAVPTPALACVSWDAQSVDKFKHQFTILEPNFVYTDDKAFWQYDYMLVLRGCVAKLGGVFTSDEDFAPIDALVSELEPFAARQAQPATMPNDETVDDKAWSDDPRLVNFWEFQTFPQDCVERPTKRHRVKGRHSGDMVLADEADARAAALDVDGLVEELYRRRLELDERCVDKEEPQFERFLRGGAWTAKKKGVAYDCIATRPKPGIAVRMMEHYALQKTSSYAVAKYTDQLADDLASCWIELHSFFLDEWVAADEDPAFDLRGAKKRFVEGAAFASVDASGHAAAIARLRSIRHISPRDVLPPI